PNATRFRPDDERVISVHPYSSRLTTATAKESYSTRVRLSFSCDIPDANMNTHISATIHGLKAFIRNLNSLRTIRNLYRNLFGIYRSGIYLSSADVDDFRIRNRSISH